MLIFYVDESGHHALSAPSPYFVLAAVGIRDTSRKPLAEALLALKARHFGDHAAQQPWAASEIKGSNLARLARSVDTKQVPAGPLLYRELATAKQSDALVEDVGRVFYKFRPLIFAIAVDKAALPASPTLKGEHPLGIAYTYLSRRVAQTMERLHAGEAAILVADQQKEHEAYFRSGELHATRERLTKGMRTDVNVVLDKPLWIDTDLSAWDREILQLPDIVAYAVGELLKRGEAPTEPYFLWQRIKPHFAVQWATGEIESGGLAIYPKPKQYPAL